MTAWYGLARAFLILECVRFGYTVGWDAYLNLVVR